MCDAWLGSRCECLCSACRKAIDGLAMYVSEKAPSVKVAPAPLELVKGSIATAGLLAHILVAKFVDHMPFYRQEQQFLRLGVEISRVNMTNWAMQVAEALIPVSDLMKEALLEGGHIHTDETPVQVLKEPGREPTTKSYMVFFLDTMGMSRGWGWWP